MRIVVTGASGNIGTALLRRLDGSGHTVVGVARRPPPEVPIYDVAAWHAIDITAPDAGPLLRAHLTGADAVVHLVWGFQPSHDAAYLRRLEIDGTRTVLAASIEAGVPHFVHFSSLGAYSPRADDRAVDETWPTGGIDRLPYSRHKAAIERLLDDEDRRVPRRIAIARVRPALVAHELSAGATLRYTYPAWAPTALLRHLPVLPLDRGFRAQFVHAADLADATCRIIEQRATGAFNVAAEPVVRRDDIARVLGARAVHVPWAWLRALAAVTWRLRLQPVDPGWLDLAAAVPRMSARRAREELGWTPRMNAVDAVSVAVDGIRRGNGTASPALRRRRWGEEVVRALRHGPVSHRRVP